jgi:hypothetical protein
MRRNEDTSIGVVIDLDIQSRECVASFAAAAAGVVQDKASQGVHLESDCARRV